MNIEDQIERAENKIAVKRVELDDWIPAKCLIDERIVRLKAEIEAWEFHLRVLKDEAGK